MVITGQDAVLLHWARKNGFEDCGPASAMGFSINGEIVAVAVFFNYRSPDIEIGVISKTPRWASRGHLKAIAQYVYGQLNCSRLTAHVNASDSKLCGLMGRLGFQREGTLRAASAFGDVAVYGLLKEECRWYEKP